MPCSAPAPAAPPAPSRIPCADARPTLATSATVPSKSFFLIVLRCIVSSSLVVPVKIVALTGTQEETDAPANTFLISADDRTRHVDVRRGTVRATSRALFLFCSANQSGRCYRAGVPPERLHGSCVGPMTCQDRGNKTAEFANEPS